MVNGDANFGSLETCIACIEHGLHFVGPVKTNYSKFPKFYFKHWFENNEPTPKRGEYIVAKSTINNSPVYALSWIDNKQKDFIFTRGNTALSNKPKTKILHKIVVDENGAASDSILIKQTPLPEVTRGYFEVCGVIDANDGKRQGRLNIESSWETKNWWWRLWCTVGPGICSTDAFLHYIDDYKRIVKNDKHESYIMWQVYIYF